MKTKASGNHALKIALSAWAIACISLFAYYPGRLSYIHWSNLANWQLLPEKLGRLQPLQDILAFLFSLVGIIIFSAACTSLGSFIVSRTNLEGGATHPSNLSKIAIIATEFLIGHGIYSTIFIVLGIAHQITPVNVAILLAAGLLTGFAQLKKSLPKVITESWAGLRNAAAKREDRLILVLLGCALFASLLNSSARISYDSTSIYFSNAKLTALTHHIDFFLNDTFIVSAFQSSIQFTALMQIFGDQSARLFSWVCGLIILIFSLALGERAGLSRRAIYILFAMLMTTTAFTDLMGDGKVDLISSAPAIAAIYWLVISSEDKPRPRSLLLLIGFLAGLAVVARPFNGFLLGVLIFLFLAQKEYFREGIGFAGIKTIFMSLTWVALGSLGWGVFHLIENWLILGHPFAFLSSVSSINVASGPWGYDPDQIMIIRLLYPFAASFYNTPQTLGNVSPLFIAFLPVVIVSGIQRKIKVIGLDWILFVISLIALLLWIFLFFTVLEIRYVLFLWIILYLPIAKTIAAMWEHEEYLMPKLTTALLIGLLIFIVTRTLFIAVDTYSPVDANNNPQCYDSPFCEYLRPINEIAPEGARVLTLGSFRYYLRSDLFACSTSHEEYSILQKLSREDPEAFWVEVYRQGYQFIAYENDYTTRHLQFGMIPSPENTPDWLTIEPIYGEPSGLEIAYRIHVTKPPVNAEFICKKNDLQIWEVRPVIQK